MQGSEIVIPSWFWIVFLFAIGCCVGSFLNVVIYRMPRDKSLVRPPSSCPSCGKHIRFYDNIPLVSWLLLCGKCRYCKARISPRYFVIELLTGLVFVGMFALYFHSGLRHGIPAFLSGGWFLYLISIILLFRAYRVLGNRSGDVDYPVVHLLVRHGGGSARRDACASAYSSCDHSSLFSDANDRRFDICQPHHGCFFDHGRNNRTWHIIVAAGHGGYKKKLRFFRDSEFV